MRSWLRKCELASYRTVTSPYETHTNENSEKPTREMFCLAQSVFFFRNFDGILICIDDNLTLYSLQIHIARIYSTRYNFRYNEYNTLIMYHSLSLFPLSRFIDLYRTFSSSTLRSGYVENAPSELLLSVSIPSYVV